MSGKAPPFGFCEGELVCLGDVSCRKSSKSHRDSHYQPVSYFPILNYKSGRRFLASLYDPAHAGQANKTETDIGTFVETIIFRAAALPKWVWPSSVVVSNGMVRI